MRTVRNGGKRAITVAWCVFAPHYASGEHVAPLGLGCNLRTRTIPPGARLTYDERAGNGAAVDSVVVGAGLEAT